MLAPVKTRTIRAPRAATSLSARTWMTEAPLRMLMNNLDPGGGGESRASSWSTAGSDAPPAIGTATTGSSRR